jgi:hypothetical protein
VTVNETAATGMFSIRTAVLKSSRLTSCAGCASDMRGRGKPRLAVQNARARVAARLDAAG